MSEKTLKTRIVHKHDTQENWIKAENFIPKQGEIIVYDRDDTYTYERFKIGDGETNVNDLPFVASPEIMPKISLSGSNIFTDDLITNKVDLSGATLTFDTSASYDDTWLRGYTYLRSSGDYAIQMLKSKPHLSLYKRLSGASYHEVSIYAGESTGWLIESLVLPDDFGYITEYPSNGLTDTDEKLLNRIVTNLTKDATIVGGGVNITIADENGTLATQEWIQENIEIPNTEEIKADITEINNWIDATMNGGVTVDSANKDTLGNVIHETYVEKEYVEVNYATLNGPNTFNITTHIQLPGDQGTVDVKNWARIDDNGFTTYNDGNGVTTNYNQSSIIRTSYNGLIQQLNFPSFIDEPDVVNLATKEWVLKNGGGLENLKTGNGSGSLVQTGFTEAGVYEDFRYYAAAYAIASTQTTEITPEVIEATMMAYSYGTLITMIAGAMFGGSVESAEGYLDQMIAQELSGFTIVENGVEGPASTALGVGNTVYAPASFVTGAYNILGKRGYPHASISSFVSGLRNFVAGRGDIVVGIGQHVDGDSSAVFGSAGTYNAVGNTELEQERKNKFLNNILSIKESNLPYDEKVLSVLPDATSTEWSLGYTFGNNNLTIGSNVTESNNNITSGSANYNFGHNNIVFGSQNVNLHGYYNLVGGTLNCVKSTYDGRYGVWRETQGNIISGRENSVFAANSLVGGYLNTVGDYHCHNLTTILNNTITWGGCLINDTDHGARFGYYNSENSDAILQIGNGESDTDRSNAFEVLKDGRAKVFKAPEEDNDVVRKFELNKLLEKIDLLEAKIAELEALLPEIVRL